MAYQSNLLGDFWRSYRQKRVGSGRSLSQSEMGGLLGPMLEYDAQKAQQAGQREQQQNQFNANLALQQRAQKDQKLASMVGGVGQLAMLPMAYGAAKNMGWLGGGKQPNNLMGSDTAQGTVAPAAASTTAQGGAASVPGSMVAETGGAPGMGAIATVPETSLLGTASTAALPAAIGSTAGRFLGAPISKALGTHQKTTQDVSSVMGGAAAGLIATGGNPIGGVVGGIIGGISSLF